jgi:membrane-associated phospholipid phosphatase
MHNLISMRPYACLPSMHVALSVLPVCILYSVLKSIWIRIFSTLLAVLITVSTLTLKEHYFLDALAGLLLALIFYGFWRGDLKNFIKKQKV